VKEYAKKRNIELLAEQKLLTSTGKQLDHDSEKQFGDQIKQATLRMEALEKEIEDVRQESIELEDEIRYV